MPMVVLVELAGTRQLGADPISIILNQLGFVALVLLVGVACLHAAKDGYRVEMADPYPQTAGRDGIRLWTAAFSCLRRARPTLQFQDDLAGYLKASFHHGRFRRPADAGPAGGDIDQSRIPPAWQKLEKTSPAGLSDFTPGRYSLHHANEGGHTTAAWSTGRWSQDCYAARLVNAAIKRRNATGLGWISQVQDNEKGVRAGPGLFVLPRAAGCKEAPAL